MLLSQILALITNMHSCVDVCNADELWLVPNA